jgi:hypothetical protein
LQREGQITHVEFIIGLPRLADNPLLKVAKKLNAPVLMSANSFSRWTEGTGREWAGFNRQSLRHATGLRLHLDSAGFVASSRYGEFPWTVAEYIELAAAFPWEWFASMDWCVEREVAPSESTVLNRISGTVRLNAECRMEAERRGIADRLMPVIQGWRPEHYLRCIDRMAGLLDVPLIGVGSMCRRQVDGAAGILEVVEAIDRELGTNPARLHLFGLKSGGMEELRAHPRVMSVDSQAYGTAARMQAGERRAFDPKFSKSNVFTAAVMERWYGEQVRRINRPAGARRVANIPLELLPLPSQGFDAALERSEEQLRQLHETGELAWGNVCSRWAFEGAFDEIES